MSETASALNLIADQLRALANNGLLFTQDPYQIERFHKILRLAAELHAMTDPRSTEDFAEIMLREIEWRTPLAVVDTAVFDNRGHILLIQRADDGRWAMPGGGCDVGEAPATGAAREVWEETGIEIEITTLLGVFDSRICGSKANRHLYHFLFGARPNGGRLIASTETLDAAWFTPAEIPWSALSPGHGQRIHVALTWQRFPETPVFFDRPDQLPTDELHFSHRP